MSRGYLPRMLSVVPIYAALITALLLLLSARVIRYRRAAGISLGDAGDKELQRRVRAQGNCAEYAPLGLLLLLILELQGTDGVILHILGLLLLAGRLAHAAGLWSHPHVMTLRVGGMALTLTMLGLAALALAPIIGAA